MGNSKQLGQGLRGRLTFLLGVPIAVIIGQGALSFWSMQRADKNFKQVTQQDVPLQLVVSRLRINSESAFHYFLEAELDGGNASARTAKLGKAHQLAEKIDGDLSRFQSLANTSEEKAMGQKMGDAWSPVKSGFGQVSDLLSRNNSRSDQDAKKFIQEKLSGSLESFARALKSAEDDVGDNVASITQSTIDASARSLKFLYLLSLGGPLAAAVVGLFLATRMSRDLGRVGQSLERAALEIQNTSKQVASIGMGLTDSSNEQSAAIEQTVASMEEMSSMIANTTSSVQDVLRSAVETQRRAESGAQTIGSLKSSVQEISQANDRLQEINHVIEEINEKTKVINDIVAETRMLSFNASIEAARAGEHGRGFAVVAEQIGNLAKMSGKAAQEIRVLINKSTSQVNTSIAVTRDKVGAGQKISEECATAFGRIIENIGKLNPMVDSMANSTIQQETGIAQTNRAMQKLDSMASQAMKRATEAASTGTRLEMQYRILADAVSDLRRFITGNAAVLDSYSGPGTGAPGNVVSLKPGAGPVAAAGKATSKFGT